MTSSITLAASIFWASPGRARNAIVAEQIEKSAKLAEFRDVRDRIDVIVNRQVAQRLGPDLEVFIVQQIQDRRVGGRIPRLPAAP